MHIQQVVSDNIENILPPPETEELKENCLKDILEWLNNNPQINAHKDDESLLYFLRACKFNMDRTKNKIRSFYRMRAERTEWFLNRDPFLPEIQELLQLGVFLPVKQKDELNRQIFIIRTAAHDPRKHEQNNVFKVGKMLLDIVLKMDNTISSDGLVAVFDMKGVTLSHALQLTPTIIRKSVESWQIYPCKTKILEFINAPPHVNVVLNTFRLFMTPKMKSRIIIRRGTSEIKCGSLPIDLGGSGESYQELANYWKNVAEQNAKYFMEDEKYKSIL